MTERWGGTDCVEVDDRHVPLRHQTTEAEAKVKAAKKGLRGVVAELKALHQEEALDDSDWEADDAICAVCRGGEATDENDIAVCDKCNTPYHQHCHVPVLREKDLGDEEDEWWCRRCDLIYDRLSNAVLDAYGVDEERARTWRKVQTLLQGSDDEQEDGAAGGAGDEDDSEEDDSDYETESSDEDDDNSEVSSSEEEEEEGSGAEAGGSGDSSSSEEEAEDEEKPQPRRGAKGKAVARASPKGKGKATPTKGKGKKATPPPKGKGKAATTSSVAKKGKAAKGKKLETKKGERGGGRVHTRVPSNSTYNSEDDSDFDSDGRWVGVDEKRRRVDAWGAWVVRMVAYCSLIHSFHPLTPRVVPSFIPPRLGLLQRGQL